jgi:hypothetical protein
VTIIFPHVPKCGGTSIAVQLEAANGVKLLLDYDAPPMLNPFHARKCERRNREFALLDFRPFDVVYGHFPLERYRSPDYRYVTLVREPLERAVSQFNFLVNRRKKGVDLPRPTAEMADRIIAGEVSFSKWLNMMFGKTTTYEIYLGMRPASDFHLIGTMDRYPEFCARLSDLLGVEISAEVKERPAGEFRYEPAPEDDWMIRKVLGREMEWYAQIAAEAAAGGA